MRAGESCGALVLLSSAARPLACLFRPLFDFFLRSSLLFLCTIVLLRLQLFASRGSGRSSRSVCIVGGIASHNGRGRSWYRRRRAGVCRRNFAKYDSRREQSRNDCAAGSLLWHCCLTCFAFAHRHFPSTPLVHPCAGRRGGIHARSASIVRQHVAGVRIRCSVQFGDARGQPPRTCCRRRC